MTTALSVGFLTGFSLILAIGAQNAFVLRHGLMRLHVFPLCLFCAASDALLIVAGVAGFAAITGAWPAFPMIMAIAGAAFLLGYGALRFHAAWRCSGALEAHGAIPSLRVTLATAAAFTWLNPHVYLDTVGLIGAISTQYDGALRIMFGAGAISASFVFFFGLGYGARWLAPLLQTARAWRFLDALIGAVMWLLAAKLIAGALD